MRRLFLSIVIVALFAMNIGGTAHAECSHVNDYSDMQISEVIHSGSSQHGDEHQTNCDCCGTCSSHHHHSHTAFLNNKADSVITANQTLHKQDGDTYFSHLNYPPSRPPKA